MFGGGGFFEVFLHEIPNPESAFQYILLRFLQFLLNGGHGKKAIQHVAENSLVRGIAQRRAPEKLEVAHEPVALVLILVEIGAHQKIGSLNLLEVAFLEVVEELVLHNFSQELDHGLAGLVFMRGQVHVINKEQHRMLLRRHNKLSMIRVKEELVFEEGNQLRRLRVLGEK